jgi:hypothetical protein
LPSCLLSSRLWANSLIIALCLSPLGGFSQRDYKLLEGGGAALLCTVFCEMQVMAINNMAVKRGQGSETLSVGPAPKYLSLTLPFSLSLSAPHTPLHLNEQQARVILQWNNPDITAPCSHCSVGFLQNFLIPTSGMTEWWKCKGRDRVPQGMVQRTTWSTPVPAVDMRKGGPQVF